MDSLTSATGNSTFSLTPAQLQRKAALIQKRGGPAPRVSPAEVASSLSKIVAIDGPTSMVREMKASYFASRLAANALEFMEYMVVLAGESKHTGHPDDRKDPEDLDDLDDSEDSEDPPKPPNPSKPSKPSKKVPKCDTPGEGAFVRASVKLMRKLDVLEAKERRGGGLQSEVLDRQEAIESMTSKLWSRHPNMGNYLKTKAAFRETAAADVPKGAAARAASDAASKGPSKGPSKEAAAANRRLSQLIAGLASSNGTSNTASRGGIAKPKPKRKHATHEFEDDDVAWLFQECGSDDELSCC